MPKKELLTGCPQSAVPYKDPLSPSWVVHAAVGTPSSHSATVPLLPVPPPLLQTLKNLMCLCELGVDACQMPQHSCSHFSLTSLQAAAAARGSPMSQLPGTLTRMPPLLRGSLPVFGTSDLPGLSLQQHAVCRHLSLECTPWTPCTTLAAGSSSGSHSTLHSPGTQTQARQTCVQLLQEPGAPNCLAFLFLVINAVLYE